MIEIHHIEACQREQEVAADELARLHSLSKRSDLPNWNGDFALWRHKDDDSNDTWIFELWETDEGHLNGVAFNIDGHLSQSMPSMDVVQDEIDDLPLIHDVFSQAAIDAVHEAIDEGLHECNSPTEP